ncbi:hypothetical protein TruAng_008137 [Truncatella angustata]|nr:hypothetical protein TruAng_008137 [Truncatella angustata]
MAVSDLLSGNSLSFPQGRAKNQSSRFNFVTSALFLLLFLLVGHSILPTSHITLDEVHVEKREPIRYEDPVAFNESLQSPKLVARAGDPNDPPWTKRVTNGNRNAEDFHDNSAEAYADETLGTDKETEEVPGYLAMDSWIDTSNENTEVDVSPTDIEKDGGPKAPPLKRWSDIMAIEWSREEAASALNFVIRSGITNDNTKAMIKQAYISTGRTKVPTYPGVDFAMAEGNTKAQTEAFYGLLGTYHGAGVAYMLAQHRAVFGKRRIERIRAWALTTEWDLTKDTLQNVGMIVFISAVP